MEKQNEQGVRIDSITENEDGSFSVQLGFTSLKNPIKYDSVFTAKPMLYGEYDNERRIGEYGPNEPGFLLSHENEYYVWSDLEYFDKNYIKVPGSDDKYRMTTEEFERLTNLNKNGG